ncbi:hypothetical protein [Actinoplanes subtropicus]|uniref:hypothetical protein n=1 Tax=Actinoplanes subtropicus TaxID=543632 RepID=UPI0012F7BBFA|nr:hypothetical protein [Actinoplanes subtropicus]
MPARLGAGTSSGAAADAGRARLLRLARLRATLLLAGPFPSAVRQPADRELLDYHRRLLALRARHPELCPDDFLVIANLAAGRRRIAVPPWPRGVLIASRLGVTLNADAVELPGECAAVIGYR